MAAHSSGTPAIPPVAPDQPPTGWPQWLREMAQSINLISRWVGTVATAVPLREDGTGGVVLDPPAGATTESYFGVTNGGVGTYLGAIDGEFGYASAFGGRLVLQGQPGVGINGVLNFADDTAAAAGGLDVGTIYRTGSILKIRVT